MSREPSVRPSRAVRGARLSVAPTRVQQAADVPSGVARAEALAARLDKPMGALGVLFLLVILAQNVSSPPVSSVVAGIGWVLWAVFVAELALRAYVARDRRAFWRRNWWQVLFLAVPFLRFARALRAVRVARIGGVLTSAVRGSRSAGRLLTSRIAWLALVSAVVILATSQLLVIVGAYERYVDALHAAALATIAAEPLSSDHGAARWLEVGLAVYSVAVFATLAGALGAYFLEQRQNLTRRPGPRATER